MTKHHSCVVSDQPSAGNRRWWASWSRALCITERTWTSTSSILGLFAEVGNDVDRFEYLINDLGRQRHIGREERRQAEWEPDAEWQDL
jgi:hypothetical protein